MADITPVLDDMPVEEAEVHFHNLAQMLMSPTILLAALKRYEASKQEYIERQAVLQTRQNQLASLDASIKARVHDEQTLLEEIKSLTEKKAALQAGLDALMHQLTTQMKD